MARAIPQPNPHRDVVQNRIAVGLGDFAVRMEIVMPVESADASEIGKILKDLRQPSGSLVLDALVEQGE
jgi:hypothetical protein